MVGVHAPSAMPVADNGMVPQRDSSVTPVPPKKQRPEKSRPSIFWVLAGIVIPIGSLLARFRVVDGDKLPQTRRLRASRRTTTARSTR